MRHTTFRFALAPTSEQAKDPCPTLWGVAFRVQSERLRNKKDPSGRDGIRVGEGHPRSVTLPKIGTIRVHDDTRRLRRMLRPIKHLDPRPGEAVAAPRARVLSATVIRRVDRWHVCLNIEAPAFHPGRRHQHRSQDEGRRFVGIDRGLTVFAVVADEVSGQLAKTHSGLALEDLPVAP